MASGVAGPEVLKPPHAAPDVPDADDRLIERRLNQTSRHIQWVDWLSTIGFVLTWVLGYLLIVALIDHWVLDLRAVGRWLALIGLIAGTLVLLGLRLWPLVRYRINPLYAARMIEVSRPELKNGLINLLLLRARYRLLPSQILQGARRQAVQGLTEVSWDEVVDRGPIVKTGVMLASVIGAICLYLVLSPKNPLQTAQRVVAPWQEIARPSQVQIRDLEPGNAQVRFGQQVPIQATVEGARADDPVWLIYRSADGQFLDQQLAMSIPAGETRYQGILPPADPNIQTGRQGIQQDLFYRIVAGDAETPEYHLSVTAAPQIIVERATFEYPSYQERAKLERNGTDVSHGIRDVEGTRVTLHLSANQAISSGSVKLRTLVDKSSLIVAGGGDGRGAPVPLEFTDVRLQVDPADAQRATASFLLELQADRQTPLYESFEARFVAPEGGMNQDPVVHRIGIDPDQAPHIEVLSPRAQEIEIPENSSQEIEIRALDPDFKLTRLQLQGTVAGRQVLDAGLLSEPRTGQVVVKYRVRPKGLGLANGHVLELMAVAYDNRHAPRTGQPEPNMTKASTIRVNVTAPIPLEDAQHDPAAAGDDPGSSSGEGGDQGGAEGQSGAAGESGADGGAGGDQAKEAAGSNQEGEPAADRSNRSEDPQGEPQGNQRGGEEKGGEASSASPQDADRSEGRTEGNGSNQTGSEEGEAPSPGDQGEKGGSGSPGAGGSGDERQAPTDSVADRAGDPSAGGGERDGEDAGGPGSDTDDGAASNATDPGRSHNGNDSTPERPLPNDGAADGDIIERINRFREAQQAKDGSTQGKVGNKEGDRGDGKRPDDADKPPSGATGPQENATSGPDGQGDAQEGGDKNKEPSPEDRPGKGMAPSEEGERTAPQNRARPDADRTDPSTQGNDASPPGEDRQGPGPSPDRPDRGKTGQGKREDQSKQPGSGTKGDSQPVKDKGEATPGESPGPDSESGDSANESSPSAGDTAGQEGSEDKGSPSPAAAPDAQEAPGNAPGDGRSGQGKGPANSDRSRPSDTSPASSDGDPAGQPGSRSATRPAGAEQDAAEPGQQGSPAGSSPGPGDAADSVASDGSDPAADAANLEYARKATELALQTLREQQDNPDKRLLEELGGWTKDDVREFVNRWDEMKRDAREGTANRRQDAAQFEEALRSLGLHPPQPGERHERRGADQLQQLKTSGRRSQPPAQYRDLFKAYQSRPR